MYVYELTGDGSDWRTAVDDRWETEIYNPDGLETEIGFRRVDGTRVRVFRSTDGAVRAIVDVQPFPLTPGGRRRRSGVRGGWVDANGVDRG